MIMWNILILIVEVISNLLANVIATFITPYFKNRKKLLISIFVALIMFLMINRYPENVDISDWSYWQNKPSLEYTVHIQDSITGDDIEDAEVQLEIGIAPPQLKNTRTDGSVTFEVSTSYLGQLGTLIVKAPYYKRRTKDITVMEDSATELILLQPAP
ncbi:MAG TPA: hypothetical protein VFZ66_27420 [Herpetosiphonaceae bacterium]